VGVYGTGEADAGGAGERAREEALGMGYLAQAFITLVKRPGCFEWDAAIDGVGPGEIAADQFFQGPGGAIGRGDVILNFWREQGRRIDGGVACEAAEQRDGQFLFDGCLGEQCEGGNKGSISYKEQGTGVWRHFPSMAKRPQDIEGGACRLGG
jgi:hypothetical protein